MNVQDEWCLTVGEGRFVFWYPAWSALHVWNEHFTLVGRHLPGELDNLVDATVGEFLEVMRLPVVPRAVIHKPIEAGLPAHP